MSDVTFAKRRPLEKTKIANDNGSKISLALYNIIWFIRSPHIALPSRPRFQHIALPSRPLRRRRSLGGRGSSSGRRRRQYNILTSRFPSRVLIITVESFDVQIEAEQAQRAEATLIICTAREIHDLSRLVDSFASTTNIPRQWPNWQFHVFDMEWERHFDTVLE